jgi:hypothetical protein
MRERFGVFALEGEEYFETVERLAERGIARSYRFDGVITSAAAKWGADTVYPWDVDDLELVTQKETGISG